MIFVTVGAQMPFDRLVRAVDTWAGRTNRSDVFAQTGETSWQPLHVEWARFLDPPAFRQLVSSASVIVAHAGMGSILTALTAAKPILVMPRRGDLRETRNDHQIATARRFRELGKVAVAFDEHELADKLDNITTLQAPQPIDHAASPELIAALRDFVSQKAETVPL